MLLMDDDPFAVQFTVQIHSMPMNPSPSTASSFTPSLAAENNSQKSTLREIESLSAQTTTVTLTETSSSQPPPPPSTAASASASLAAASLGEQTVANEEVYAFSVSSTRPHVTWDEATVDNEGLGRKSSKRCCIFHKPREFGESSTESEDEEEDGGGSDSEGDDSSRSSSGSSSDEYGRAGVAGHQRHKKTTRRKKIARPKKQTVPDFQRYHA